MPDPPTGTVTLVFTDIESSTRLVQELGDAYAELLDEHRDVLRSAALAAGGREIDCRGDEFSMAFTDPTSAVTAALHAQSALAARPWPNGVELRVRMGMHTGRPTPEGRGYLGLDVHRTARVCDAGHGGQVLVSSATRAAVDAYEFKDLGDYALKGIEAPERIFQLVMPGLPLDFPPLRIDGQAADEESSASAEFAMKVVLADD